MCVLKIENGLEQMQVPPHFVLDPQDTEVAIGGNVEFSCNATGLPLPEIVWLRDESALEINGVLANPNKTIDSMTAQADSNSFLVVSILYIEQVDETDMGIYSCLATNNLTETLSTASAGAQLTVLSKYLYSRMPYIWTVIVKESVWDRAAFAGVLSK